MSDVCRACKAPLIWAITKDGKRAPITREQSPNGNVLVFRTVTPGPVQARTFAGMVLMELQAEGVPLRLNHFADCPNAEDFQR
jgi:hypothetical protein